MKSCPPYVKWGTKPPDLTQPFNEYIKSELLLILIKTKVLFFVYNFINNFIVEILDLSGPKLRAFTLNEEQKSVKALIKQKY